jgi:hypothetical protein
VRAASAFDSVASSLQQVISLLLSRAALFTFHNSPFVTHPRLRALSSTFCLWITLRTAQRSSLPRKSHLLLAQSFAMLGHLKLPISCQSHRCGVFPAILRAHPFLAPFFHCRPSSPTSAPSSVRPRRVRTRNSVGGGAAISPQTADVEIGKSLTVSAFMPPNGVASPLSSTPDSSRASSRNAPHSQHPNGVPSPLSSSPPSPSMSDA